MKKFMMSNMEKKRMHTKQSSMDYISPIHPQKSLQKMIFNEIQKKVTEGACLEPQVKRRHEKSSSQRLNTLPSEIKVGMPVTEKAKPFAQVDLLAILPPRCWKQGVRFSNALKESKAHTWFSPKVEYFSRIDSAKQPLQYSVEVCQPGASS